MKIVQNIKLMRDLGINTWLGEEHCLPLLHSELLLGPLEFSFHPFNLRAWQEADNLHYSPLKADLTISWRLLILDDEDEKALIKLKSSHRTLLLFSEMLQGLFECARAVGMTVESVKTEPLSHLILLDLSWKAGTDAKRLIGGALFMKAMLDSLLFCRGLSVGEGSLESEESHFKAQLSAIFLGKL